MHEDDLQRLRIAIRTRAGCGAPAFYQSEALTILSQAIDAADGARVVAFTYTFDQDHASQYDKTLRFEGTARDVPPGAFDITHLELVHRGEAAQ